MAFETLRASNQCIVLGEELRFIWYSIVKKITFTLLASSALSQFFTPAS